MFNILSWPQLWQNRQIKKVIQWKLTVLLDMDAAIFFAHRSCIYTIITAKQQK